MLEADFILAVYIRKQN